MTVNSPVNSPSARASRLDEWQASQNQQRGDNSARSRSPVGDVKRSRSVTPPRSGAESEGEDEEFYFNDNDSTCSGSEEPAGTQAGKGTWTTEEHKRFLEAIKIYVNGPWKLVAEYVGTRTVRQTMTHAQKYRQKAARRIRGLRTKQAIMRMHQGHEVSEESMVQEQIRTMLGQSRHAYLPPELCAQLNYSPSASPVGSPVGSPVMPRSPMMHHGGGSIPGSPVLHHSPAASPFMPSSPVASPYMPNSPMLYQNNSMLPSLTLEDHTLHAEALAAPLSITIRPSSMVTSDPMAIYAPASPHSAYAGSPAASPVSSLTARMDGFDLDVIEDNGQGPSLQECEMLMDVLFDNQPSDQSDGVPKLEPEIDSTVRTPGTPFDIDI